MDVKKERTGKRRAWIAAVLAAGLLFSAPLWTGGSADAVDLGDGCSLKVNASDQYTEDIAQANVVIDLYKVAGAEADAKYDSYHFNVEDAFTNLEDGLSYDQLVEATTADWQSMAADAAETVLAEDSGLKPDYSVGAGTDLDNVEPGLYLVIAHGDGLEEYVEEIEAEDGSTKTVTTAQSSMYKYLFTPELVALPTKNADETGTIRTSNEGEWIYSQTITLKPEQTTLYGSLEIDKTLTSYENGEEATFVFDVTAEIDGEIVYTNVAGIHFTAPGTQSAILDKIPAGATVTVTEVYSGSSYSLTSSATQTAVIDATEMVSVSFTNAYNGHAVHGHGITNHFTNQEHGGWEWTTNNSNPQ